MSYLLGQNDKGYWVVAIDPVTGEKCGEMINVHSPQACAEALGCAIHNRPSDHPLKNAKMLWRNDRGILERLCEHGVGHPDADSAAYLASIGRSNDNIHGCDGCCMGKSEHDAPESTEKSEFWASMRVEIVKGPRPVDVLFGEGEPLPVKTFPNPVAPPFKTPDFTSINTSKSDSEIESAYYDWRTEQAGKTLSLKDAFFAGAKMQEDTK
jgi:hypothetical protein